MIEPDRTVDERGGNRVVNEWAKHAGLSSRAWISQKRSLANLLSAKCVAESIRLLETEGDLWERLVRVGEILDGLWYACALQQARDYHYKPDEVPQEHRSEFEREIETIWSRHDPITVHDKGYEATRYPGVDRNAVSRCAAEYLARPWLRVAAFDWFLVDSLVTDEIIRYGEHLKAKHLPGPQDWTERASFDRKTKGDVAAIMKEGRRYRTRPWLLFLTADVALPIAIIAIAAYFNAFKTAFALAALVVLGWGWAFLRALIIFFRRMRATPKQLLTSKARDYERWASMVRVWRLLAGPVVNPTLLRAEMAKTTEAGASWESAAWSIVDRVIGIDAAVWIVTFPST